MKIYCTINSKINGTPKVFYLSIWNIRYILAVAKLLAHNNITICYYGQINSLRLKSNVASEWASKHLLEVSLILLLMLHLNDGIPVI